MHPSGSILYIYRKCVCARELYFPSFLTKARTYVDVVGSEGGNYPLVKLSLTSEAQQVLYDT